MDDELEAGDVPQRRERETTAWLSCTAGVEDEAAHPTGGGEDAHIWRPEVRKPTHPLVGGEKDSGFDDRG